MGRRSGRSGGGGVVFGAVLIFIGALMLINRTGWADVGHWWNYWPLILIVSGLAKLLFPGDAERFGSGVTLTLMGIVFQAIVLNWWDLDWGNGWPLILIAAGAGLVARALAVRFGGEPSRGTGEEDTHAS